MGKANREFELMMFTGGRSERGIVVWMAKGWVQLCEPPTYYSKPHGVSVFSSFALLLLYHELGDERLVS